MSRRPTAASFRLVAKAASLGVVVAGLVKVTFDGISALRGFSYYDSLCRSITVCFTPLISPDRLYDGLSGLGRGLEPSYWTGLVHLGRPANLAFGYLAALLGTICFLGFTVYRAEKPTRRKAAAYRFALAGAKAVFGSLPLYVFEVSASLVVIDMARMAPLDQAVEHATLGIAGLLTGWGMVAVWTGPVPASASESAARHRPTRPSGLQTDADRLEQIKRARAAEARTRKEEDRASRDAFERASGRRAAPGSFERPRRPTSSTLPADVREAYSILQVPVDASEAEVERAWQDWVKLLHPDRHPDAQEAATRRTKAVNNAHDTIRRWQRSQGQGSRPQSRPIAR